VKPLLLLLLLIFSTQPSFAVKNSIQLISKDYRLLSIDSPKDINSKGLFFPPNVIQFDKVNNLSYHLIDTNKIAIKEHINGALIDIIEVPIKESEYELPREYRPTINSITLDSKRNHLWLLTSYNSSFIYDLNIKKALALEITNLGSDFYLHSAVYDSEADATFIAYVSEGFPGIVKVSNSTHISETIRDNLKDFSSYREIYSLLKQGSDLILWEGAFFPEKMWVFKEDSYLLEQKMSPIRFKPQELFDNDIAANEWWGILPRAPYSQNKTRGITKLTVNNISLCESFGNEVTENYTSGKHLFDAYRQNVFGLNKFDLTKLTESPIHYTYEQEIDGLSYYITTRNLSGCGSRCNTEFNTVTS
jgi:hypothetical protein